MFDVAMEMAAGDPLLRGQESLCHLRSKFIKKLERFFSNKTSKEVAY